MTQQGFPQINAPIADPKTGRATQPWYQLIITLWNRTGGSSGTASSILDQITAVRGSLLLRGATVWQGLSPGASGKILTSQGAGADPIWSNVGTGSVTDISTGTGLTGGPITTSGTISMAQMAAKTLKGNNTNATANPADLSVSQVNTLLGVTAVGTATIGQIPGTSTNDNAPAGDVGEYVSSNNSGGTVSLTSGTAANFTSISLTAGDWDVWFDAYYAGQNTTSISTILSSISQTSATVDASPGNFSQVGGVGTVFNASAAQISSNVGPSRISLSSTTTLYAVAQATFSGGTLSVFGIISARRAR